MNTALKPNKTMTTETLATAKTGATFRIKSVVGNSCKQLRDMGFCESMQVRKITDGRTVVCMVCGVKCALNHKLAQQVIVTPV